MENDLLEFLLRETQNMENEYYRIQKRVKEDPGTAGDEGEENWKYLLKSWLPPTFHLVRGFKINNWSN